MQTSQGIGYYFALKAGKNRLLFDVLADAVFLVLLIIALAIPFLSAKTNPAGQSRFFILFVSMIPTVRTDYVFSLFFERGVSSSFNFDIWAGEVMNAYFPGILFFALALGYSCCTSANKISRKITVLTAVALFLVLPGMLMPGLNVLSLFIGAYILIYTAFILLENKEFDSCLIYGFLYMVAVYRLTEVAAAWN